MGRDPLDLETRKTLYELIRKNPGLHYRELERRSGLVSGTLEYHLQYLEERQLIAADARKGFTRYFVKKAQLTSHDKQIIGYLRQELPRGIILFLIQHRDSNQRTIAEHFDVSRPTISYHIRSMENAGVVESERRGRSKHYRILDTQRVVDLLLCFRQSFVDVLVDSFFEFWYRTKK